LYSWERRSVGFAGSVHESVTVCEICAVTREELKVSC
jgi:hypothetical protein